MKNEEFFSFLAFIKNFTKKSGADPQAGSTHLIIYISNYYLITFLPSCINSPLEFAFTC